MAIVPEVNDITTMSDIPNFPFASFEAFRSRYKKGNINLLSYYDRSGDWLILSPRSPKIIKFILSKILLLNIVSPLAFIVASIFLKEWVLFAFSPLLFGGFLILTPQSERLIPPLKWIFLLIGYLFYEFFFNGGEKWILYLLLTISIPWVTNKVIYKWSASQVIKISLRNEDDFIDLFKNNVIALDDMKGNIFHLYDYLAADDLGQGDTNRASENDALDEKSKLEIGNLLHEYMSHFGIKSMSHPKFGIRRDKNSEFVIKNFTYDINKNDVVFLNELEFEGEPILSFLETSVFMSDKTKGFVGNLGVTMVADIVWKEIKRCQMNE